jgi:hypothetical protein
MEVVHRALIDRLSLTTALPRPEATRVVGDLLDYFSESIPDLVRRRHRELQGERASNTVAFEHIQRELDLYRVRPPELSLRQLRRIVYG